MCIQNAGFADWSYVYLQVERRVADLLELWITPVRKGGSL
jgi:hypothetical protein